MRLTRTSQADQPMGTTAPALPDVSQIGVPMAVLDEVGNILNLNRPLCALTGFSEQELYGTPLTMLMKDMRLPRTASMQGQALIITKNRQEMKISYSVSKAHGSSFSFVTLMSMAEEERLRGELASKEEELEHRERYIECFREGVFRMISDLDRSETELKGALKNLQETQVQLIQSSKMKALGELAASLVHEISQPLTVIRGLSHGMLRAMEESSPWRDKMRLIGDAASRMEKIVKHLKSFSRSEPPVFSPVDINNVVKDAFLILNEHLLSHSIETVLDLSNVPLTLGNPNRLEQVVINLVTNARDAMPRGGVLTVSTKVESESGSRFVRLIVKDSGDGIPAHIMNKVFDPFFTTKETGKGTGLGLSISLSIVREHKGDIRVESAPGAGTAFHVILPAIGAG